MIQLYRPVEKCPSPFVLKKRDASGNNFNLITQLFGENLADFYIKLGMKGHNGLDFIAPRGMPVYAAHDGRISYTMDQNNSSPTAGYGVYIDHEEGWWTLYFHLLDVVVKVDDEVRAGDLIGHADNTGLYTTGDHLHFGLYPKDRDKNNGYGGAIDPLLYFSQEEISGINQSNLNTMLKIIGDNKTKNQFLLGKDNEIRLIYNIDTKDDLLVAGIIDPLAEIEWIDDISKYTRGNDFISINPE